MKFFATAVFLLVQTLGIAQSGLLETKRINATQSIWAYSSKHQQ
jgi:hypothetical protein